VNQVRECRIFASSDSGDELWKDEGQLAATLDGLELRRGKHPDSGMYSTTVLLESLSVPFKHAQFGAFLCAN
jgi:hypothetical protein